MSDNLSVPDSSAANAFNERAVVLPFNIREKGLLYATYMSMIQDGAIFVPTNKELRLGDPVFIILTLPEKLATDGRFSIHGKVVWWTPPRAMYQPSSMASRANPWRLIARKPG